MKNRLVCPKCAGKRIWVIEKLRVPGESAEGRALAVVPHQPAMKPGLFQTLRASPRGHFDVFICDGCGYSEMWAGGIADLVEDPEHGVRLIDTSQAGQGPFR
jgi:predicted nucleic-acid-binding Zn-ribbon protein